MKTILTNFPDFKCAEEYWMLSCHSTCEFNQWEIWQGIEAATKEGYIVETAYFSVNKNNSVCLSVVIFLNLYA